MDVYFGVSPVNDNNDIFNNNVQRIHFTKKKIIIRGKRFIDNKKNIENHKVIKRKYI